MLEKTSKYHGRPETKAKTKWISEEINPKFSLKVQMTKFKLSYCGYIMQIFSFLEKSTMVGKFEREKKDD